MQEGESRLLHCSTGQEKDAEAVFYAHTPFPRACVGERHRVLSHHKAKTRRRQRDAESMAQIPPAAALQLQATTPPFAPSFACGKRSARAVAAFGGMSPRSLPSCSTRFSRLLRLACHVKSHRELVADVAPQTSCITPARAGGTIDLSIRVPVVLCCLHTQQASSTS